VQPETVVRWHKRRFRAYWRSISTPGPGRPPISEEIKALILRMATENPLPPLASLAPEIVSAILAGTPVTLTAQRLIKRTDLPLGWHEQRVLLDFESPAIRR
jgi:hypothetical protein